MTVVIDFLSDWKRYLLSSLASQGYRVSHDETLDAISYKFFNVTRRRIQAIQRTVHESSALSCPDDVMAGYQALQAKFVAGDDVTPHLSKSILKADHEDPLFNHWGIHHFHLGINPDSSGFTDRTGPLLFAFITPSDAYFINVLPHGAWSDQKLVHILHRNWPTVIAAFRLQGVRGLARPHANQSIAKLRKAGISTFVQVEPGVVYAPMGGGYSSAGTSIQATMDSDKYIMLVQHMETHVHDNMDIFLKKISERKRTPANPPAFSLRITDECFFAVETSSQVAFRLTPHALD